MTSGNTPLHYAATYGRLEMCQLIFNKLKKKDDKNPKNNAGITPIILAAEKKNREVFAACYAKQERLHH